MAYRSTNENDKLSLINDVNKASGLSFTMKYEADKYAKLAELAYADEVETVKRSVMYTTITFAIPKASEWLSMVETQKIDKRKKYDEKVSFEFLVSSLKDQIIGNHDFEVTSISPYGYDHYAWWLEFICEGLKFNLLIPEVDRLTVRNFKDTHNGKLSLSWYEKDYVMSVIENSYDECDIKTALDKFLTSRLSSQ